MKCYAKRHALASDAMNAATPWFCGYEDSDTGCGAAMVRSADIGGRFGCVGACLNGAVAPACILNPESLNLRQSMAFVEEISE